MIIGGERHMMKKLMGFLCALVLTIGLVAGCGQQSGSAKAAGSKAPAVEVQQETKDSGPKAVAAVDRNGKRTEVVQGEAYTDKDHVAAYIHVFRKLPPNYITKAEARKLGWKEQGTLDKLAPGKSIGGDRFGNYEKILPDKSGRKWTECDIDYRKGSRGPKRIVFSSDGLIFYSPSHYSHFEQLY